MLSAFATSEESVVRLAHSVHEVLVISLFGAVGRLLLPGNQGMER